jgi:hypothetical protein
MAGSARTDKLIHVSIKGQENADLGKKRPTKVEGASSRLSRRWTVDRRR